MILKSNKRNNVCAFTLVFAVMLISGLEYRHLARTLARPVQKMTLSKGTLAVLPINIGAWHGKDLPLNDEAAGMRDAADYLNRSYTRHAGTERVELFIRFGSRTRDLMPHRPEVCFPGNGWSQKKSTEILLQLSNDRRLACRLYQFDRQGLECGSIVVLNYYIIDGRICPDTSNLKLRALRGSEGRTYLAQVQIASFVDICSDSEAAERSVKAFAKASADVIQKVFLPLEHVVE